MHAGWHLCLLPAARLPCRLCTVRWPQGARSQFPQPGPCDQTPRAGRACTPQSAGFVLPQEGGQAARPPPRPGLLVLLFWHKRECVRVHLTRAGERIQGPQGRGLLLWCPSWQRKTRVGGGAQGIWPPEQRSQQKQGGHRVPVQCSSHAPWCVWECVCGCVSGHLALHPSPGGRAGGRCLSGEEPTAQAQLQLGPGSFGRGSKWRSLGPAESHAQTPQGDHGAAEQATDATVQGLTSSPPASNLPLHPPRPAV